MRDAWAREPSRSSTNLSIVDRLGWRFINCATSGRASSGFDATSRLAPGERGTEGLTSPAAPSSSAAGALAVGETSPCVTALGEVGGLASGDAWRVATGTGMLSAFVSTLRLACSPAPKLMSSAEIAPDRSSTRDCPNGSMTLSAGLAPPRSGARSPGSAR